MGGGLEGVVHGALYHAAGQLLFASRSLINIDAIRAPKIVTRGFLPLLGY